MCAVCMYNQDHQQGREPLFPSHSREASLASAAARRQRGIGGVMSAEAELVMMSVAMCRSVEKFSVAQSVVRSDRARFAGVHSPAFVSCAAGSPQETPIVRHSRRPSQPPLWNITYGTVGNRSRPILHLYIYLCITDFL